MTPQQQAMAKILQVTLFKLAEEIHQILDRLKQTHPQSRDKFIQMGREVEAAVDKTLEDYHKNGRNFSVQEMDKIHSDIVEIRRILG